MTAASRRFRALSRVGSWAPSRNAAYLHSLGALRSSRFGLGLPRRLLQGFGFAALLLLTLLTTRVAVAQVVAQDAPKVKKVEVEVLSRKSHLGHQTLTLRARYHVRDWQAKQALHLLSFADFFKEPVSLNRLQAIPHLQGPHVSGALTVHSLKVGGQTHTYTRDEQDQHLVVAPLSQAGPTRPAVIDLHYTVKVPRRSWPFGCVRGQCSLSGAVAPLPAQRLGDEQQLVITPTRWEFRWPKRASRPRALFVNDAKSSAKAIQFYPQVAWAGRSKQRYSTSQFFYRGVSVRIWGARGQGTAPLPEAGFWQWRKNVRREIADSVRRAIDDAQDLGLNVGWGNSLAVVVGPYFADISVPDGQNVLVSSTYMDVLPLKRFAGFHRSQLQRTLLDALAMQHLLKGGHQSDNLWVAGALGNALARRAAKRKEEQKGDIAKAVHSLRFMPMIDQMLYGGQTSNAGAFFDSVEDPLPLRNHPLYFSHAMPRGGRLAFKLRDALGQESFDTWVNTLLKKPQSSARTLAKTLGASKIPPGFFEQWLGAYPEVDYAILDIQHRKVQDHWICEVEVARKSEVDVHESVDVRFTFPDKSHKTLTWKPKGQGVVSTRLALKSKAKVRRINLDPEGKLAQVALFEGRSWERNAHGDPLFNDQKPPGSRFLYTGIGFHLAVAEVASAKTRAARLRSFDGYLSFAAGLRRDLRREFSFLIAKDRDTLLNLGGGLAFFFGRKVTSNRRRLKLAVETEVDFLTPSGLDPSRGIRTAQSLTLVDDTISFLFEPQRGHRYKLLLKRYDVWTPKPGGGTQHGGFWRLGADLSERFRLAHGHVLALQLNGEMVFVKGTPEFRGLARAGGVGRLSAFGADELFARSVAVGLAEYRHTLFDHIRVNGLGLFWMRNIGGVLSGGVGTMSGCDGFSDFGARKNWYGQVGYGLTTLVDFMGMAPEMVRVDVSVPIGRNNRTCLGKRFPDALAEAQDIPIADVKSLLPNISFNVLIDQPF